MKNLQFAINLDRLDLANETDADTLRKLFRLGDSAEKEHIFDELLKRHINAIVDRPTPQADESVTQAQASLILTQNGVRVSTSTVSAWERGIRKPAGWPGLEHRQQLEEWARTNAATPSVWKQRRGPKPNTLQMTLAF